MINTKLKIADLIYSYLKGSLSDEDKFALLKWKEQSEANKQLFENLLKKESYITKSEIYQKFTDQNRFAEIQKYIRKQKIRSLYKYAAIAAVILTPLLITIMLMYNTPLSFKKNQFSDSIKPGKSTALLYTADGKIINLEAKEFEIKDPSGTTITNKNKSLVYRKNNTQKEIREEQIVKAVVPRGGEYLIELSDGTKVWLNSESNLEHPITFVKNKRIVKVKGEAYFEVAHNKSKPFIVIAEDTKVEVLGTKFNIRAYKEEGYTATTLVEGKVRTIAGNYKPVILSPSEQFIYNKKKEEYITTEVNTELYTSWKDGLFVFDKQRLEDILNTISRWYNVDIFYDNDRLKSIVFSGRLKRYDNAENLLKIFMAIEDVKFDINGNTILVK